MIGLLQRVTEARVEVANETVGAIDQGLLVLVGVQQGDDARRAERLLERLLGYRVFPDDRGRMNLSLKDLGGGLLLVPQLPWRRIPARVPAPASPPPRHRRRVAASSICSWRRPAFAMPGSSPGALVPTCG